MPRFSGIRESVIGAILILLTIVVIAVSYLFRQVRQRDELLKEVTSNHQPAINTIDKLKDIYEQAKRLAFYRMISPLENDMRIQADQNEVFRVEIPSYLARLKELSVTWDEADRELMNVSSALLTDSLIKAYQTIEEGLNKEGFSRPYPLDRVNEKIEEGNIVFLLSEIDQNLDYLYDKRLTEVETIFNEISDRTRKLSINLLMLMILFFILLTAFASALFLHLRKNFAIVNEALKDFTGGKIPEQVKVPERSEFTSLFKNLNALSVYVSNLTELSRRILRKDFTTAIPVPGRENELGNILLSLQNDLKKAAVENSARKQEDERRNWQSDGVARMNDVLRKAGDRIEDTGVAIIRELVEYTGAHAGGLFLVNDEDENPVAILLAAFAFDRQKFLDKRINAGEGQVGRCLLEKETIYLTDIPAGYLKIKSGLGESDPASILIVPLIIDNRVYGIVELGSFGPMEDYRIRFVEMVSESIATTLSKASISRQTALLLENTRQQKEEMATQEEEMRMNMEELKAIQELSAERESKLLKEIERLKNRLMDKENPS